MVNIWQFEASLKKIYYRSAHRGCKETDIVFARFVEEKLPALSAEELRVYGQLLEEDDAHIMDWLMGYAPPPEVYRALIAYLLACMPVQA